MIDRYKRKFNSLRISILRSLWSGRGWPRVAVYRELFENKYLFSAWVRGLGGSVPRDLGIVMVNGENVREVEAAIETEGVVFGKPVSGNQGRGVHLFEWHGGNILVDRSPLFSSLERFVARECEAAREPYGYVFQERVAQHPALTSAFGEALHTVRVITVQTPSGPRVFDALIRVARKGSHVDNFSAGGLVAHVDPSCWQLDSRFDSRRGVPEDRHPDTGTRAKGFALPFGEDVRGMVEWLHAQVPTVGAIGWDIGLTPDGPTVVEGNLSMGVQMQASVYPGEFRADFLRALRLARKCTKVAPMSGR